MPSINVNLSPRGAASAIPTLPRPLRSARSSWCRGSSSFLVLTALRSLQLVPDIAVAPVTKTAAILTVLSMAALGVDVRVLSTVGGRVTAAVTLSLLLLGLSIGLVHFFK